jgi:NAD(P)-dependent dehydrogenase (short-subunit alcohol dehydrogenase family)
MAHVQQLFDLTGKSALITGGSRGLGREIAEALAEAGASITIVARRDEWLTPTLEAFRAAGFRCEGLLGDVTNAGEVRAAVARSIAAFGGLDILVNNAGVSWGSPAEDMDIEKWKMVIDTNLTGAFVFSQHAARHMIERGRGGVIINVASINALQGGLPMLETHNAGYVASKGALVALTRELAAKWGRYNIRVNALAPGYFHSRMTQRIWDRAEKLASERIPLGRPGREGELKGAAVFLASDASSYMTGQTLVIDGGTVLV